MKLQGVDVSNRLERCFIEPVASLLEGLSPEVVFDNLNSCVYDTSCSYVLYSFYDSTNNTPIPLSPLLTIHAYLSHDYNYSFPATASLSTNYSRSYVALSTLD